MTVTIYNLYLIHTRVIRQHNNYEQSKYSMRFDRCNVNNNGFVQQLPK